MNYQELKNELNIVNNKRIKLQTLIEQANNQCEQIEKKYNIKNEQELQALVDNAQLEYDKQLQEVQSYITKTNEVLNQYTGIL